MDDAEAFSRLSKYLKPAERIVWQGKPDPWVASRQAIPSVLFLSLFIAIIFSAVWNLIYSTKPNANAPFSLAVMCALLLIGGAPWFRASKFLYACWNTTYVLTDRRLMIMADGDTRSFGGAALRDLSRVGGKKRGSIRFGGITPTYARRFWGFDAFDGLYGIENPARVEALIYQTLIMPKGGSR